jgi:hypothetical protein
VLFNPDYKYNILGDTEDAEAQNENQNDESKPDDVTIPTKNLQDEIDDLKTYDSIESSPLTTDVEHHDSTTKVPVKPETDVTVESKPDQLEELLDIEISPVIIPEDDLPLPEQKEEKDFDQMFNDLMTPVGSDPNAQFLSPKTDALMAFDSFDATEHVSVSQSGQKAEPNELPLFDKSNLDYLFRFVANQGTVNEVQAGYWKNIVESLHNAKPKEFYLYFFEEPEVMENYTQHLYSKSVADSIIKFVNIDFNISPPQFHYGSFCSEDDKKSETKVSPYTCYLERRLEIYRKILEVFDKSDDYEVVNNTMNIFKDFLNRFHSISDPVEIMEQFFMDREVLDTFVGNMLYAKSCAKRLATLRFLRAMFELIASGDDRNPKIEATVEWFGGLRASEENAILATVVSNIDEIKNVFGRENPDDYFINTYAKMQPKLGAEKIAILEFVESMLAVKNVRLTSCLASSGLFTIATVFFLANGGLEIFQRLS